MPTASGYSSRFGVEKKPTILVITASWSDKGLAMLEHARAAKDQASQLQLVVVLVDELKGRAWQIAAEALKVPGPVRRAAGLGLEGPPFGPVSQIPQTYWIDARERVMQRAVGFVTAELFAAETKRLLEAN